MEEFSPFDKFGPGIKAYFQLQKMIMICMFMMTLYFIPIIAMYKRGGFYSEETINYDTI